MKVCQWGKYLTKIMSIKLKNHGISIFKESSKIDTQNYLLTPFDTVL